MVKQTISWFLKGIVVIVLLVVIAFAISVANPGLAQQITNNGGGNGAVPNAGSGVTDLPGAEVAQAGGPIQPGLNDDNSGSIARSSELRSDDPQGRNLIPAAQIPAGGNNSGGGQASSTEAGGIEGVGNLERVGRALVIPSADFRSDGYVPQGPFFSFYGGYWVGYSSSTCLMAPLYPPNGTEIYQLWSTIYDNDPTYQIWMSLFRVDNYGGIVDIMASIASGEPYAHDGWTQIYDTSVDFPIVVLPQYSYYLGMCNESTSTLLLSTRVWIYE
jgi:hypothetical protein